MNTEIIYEAKWIDVGLGERKPVQLGVGCLKSVAETYILKDMRNYEEYAKRIGVEVEMNYEKHTARIGKNNDRGVDWYITTVERVKN